MKDSLTIKEFQTILLDMMQEFHTFCEQNGLTYYMVGGTLLGAVNESGFIPWDDDVDIAMPRSDYMKFIRAFEGSLSVHTLYNDPKHMFPYAKLFLKDTPVVCIKDEEYHMNGECFAQIDLYPIDGLGNNVEKAKKRLATIRKKKKILYLNLTRSKSKNIIKRLLLFFIHRIPSRLLIQHIDKAMQKHAVETSLFVTRWREGGVKPNVVQKDIFGSPVLIPFAGHQFFAPQDAEAYLALVYNAYDAGKTQTEGLRHELSKSTITQSTAKNISK